MLLSLFKNLFHISFSFDVKLVDEISVSTGLFRLLAFILIHTSDNLHVCSMFHSCLVSHFFGARTMNVMLVNVSLLQVLRSCKENLQNMCLTCDQLAVL